MLSYIFFDVLDLDGSNFPLVPAPLERTVIVAEVRSDMQFVHSLDEVGPLGNLPDFFVDRASEYSWLQHVEFPRLSPFASARAHGYRAGLPRGSIPPLFPWF